MRSKIQPSTDGNIMEDPKKEKLMTKLDTPRDIVIDLIERAKEMDEGRDDHQGLVIGSRLREIETYTDSESS